MDWEDWTVRRAGYYSRAVRYFRAQGEESERAHQLADDAAQDCCAIEIDAGDEEGTCGSLRFWRAWRAWRRSQIRQLADRLDEIDAQRWHSALLGAVTWAEHTNEHGKTVYVRTNGLEIVRCY